MFFKRLLLFGMQLHFRFTHKDTPVDFCAHLRNARKLLVSLPCNPEDQKLLQRYLKKLFLLFPSEEISFLWQGEDHPPRLISDYHFIRASRTQLMMSMYPARSLREQIREHAFDVCIDLNQDFDFVSTVLCATTGAGVRICIEEPRREPFFNFQVKVSPESPRGRRYGRILNFLESCMTK